MDNNRIVTRAEWLDERKALLEREKAFTRSRDELSAARRALPVVEVDKDYRFRSTTGEKSLADLFGPRSQLIVQHFMFGRDWQEGCPSCSFWADSFDNLDAHLGARDTAFVLVSNAALETLQAYRERLGWNLQWVSDAGSFSEDFGVTFTRGSKSDRLYNYTRAPYGEENPGMSVFLKTAEGGKIFHTYSTYGRGLDILNSAYNLLDLTPKGRDEDDLEHSMAWVRRRDEY